MPNFDIHDSELTSSAKIAPHILKFILTIPLAVLAVLAYMSAVYEFTISISAQGTLEPITIHSIRAPVTGLIRTIYCTENDFVQENQLLAEISNPEWDRETDRIAAQVRIEESRRQELLLQIHQENAKHRLQLDIASLELQELHLKRDRVLAEQSIYTSSKFPHRRPIEELFPVKSINAAIRRQTARLDLAKQQCEIVKMYHQEVLTTEELIRQFDEERAAIRAQKARGVVRATSLGVVIANSLHRRVGEYLRAGEEILRIAQTTEWQGRVAVSEGDLPKVRLGLPASIYVAAFPHTDYRTLNGIVAKVDPKPIDGSPHQGVTYRVQIAIPDPTIVSKRDTLSLAAGLSIQAKIIVESGTFKDLATRRLLRAIGKVDEALPISSRSYGTASLNPHARASWSVGSL